MKDLSTRLETIKLLEKKNVRKKFINIGSDFFLHDTKSINNKSTHGTTSNLKASVQQRESSIKSQTTERENILENHLSNKEIISKVYKEHSSITKNKQFIFKMGKINRHIFSK